jgi:hypothetical protein
MLSRQRFIVLGIATLTVIAAIGTYVVVADTQSPPAKPPVADGPTFYGALASVNNSVLASPGGPWLLFSVYGFAAEAPFAPGVIGLEFQNWTMNQCGADFDGVTIWNGTIPVFNGSFASGTAPFWQFGYFSNVSQQFLVATSVNGVGHVFPPIPYNATPGPSTCQPWYDFPNTPTDHTSISNWTSLLRPLPPDSVGAAATAIGSISAQHVNVGTPTVEILTLGPGMFGGFGDGGRVWGVYFQRCGIVGIDGWQPLYQMAIDANDTPIGVFNLSHNCALLTYSEPNVEGRYVLAFGSQSSTVVPAGEGVLASFQVAFAAPNGTLTGYFDGWGLANWMLSLNLSGPNGSRLPVAGPDCSQWVASLADCAANTSGWYAVLLNPGDGWVASYGAAGPSVGWTVPVVSVVSHQQLMVIAPSGWNLAGSTLSVTSTTPETSIRGPALPNAP